MRLCTNIMLWGDSLMPVAGFSGMMCKSDNSDRFAIFYRYNGERESLKNKSFCSQPGSFDQFFGSIRANLYLQNQLLIRALARVMASSASKSSVLPASISLILRQISVSQASATLISAGPSKLATKSCASLALSRSDNVIAALVILSSWAVSIISTKKIKW